MPRPAANRHLLVRQMLGADRRTMPIFDALSSIPGERRVRGADVCIEGYPRSGNSWAVFCFRRWNPRARIAHHAHVPGQVLEALHARIPTAVVIRPPVDAVASYLVFSGGRVSARVALWAYTRFHDRLRAVAGELTVCGFEELTASPEVLVARLNNRFGTSFAAAELASDDRAAVLGELRDRAIELGGDVVTQQSAPSESRERLKHRARTQVLEASGLDRAEQAFGALAAFTHAKGPGSA